MKLLKFKWTQIDYSSLIADRDHHGRLKASLGKISFWVVLLPAIWFWLLSTQDIKPSHMQTLYSVVLYNLAKKSSLFGGTPRNPPPMGKDEEEDDKVDNKDEMNNRPKEFQKEGE